MPANLHMTWVASAKRWAKNYQGRSYSVSCRQLGAPPTKEASWQAANAWWEAKEAGLDEASRPPTHPVVRLVYDIVKGGGAEGLLDQAERGKAARDILQILSTFSGDKLDDPRLVVLASEAHVSAYEAGSIPPDLVGRATGGDPALAREIQVRLPRLLPAPAAAPERTVGGQAASWLEILRASVAAGQMDPARYDSYRGNVNIFRDWIGAERPVDAVTPAEMELFHAHLLHQIGERHRWELSRSAPGKGERKPGYARAYAHSIFGTVKRFVTRLADHGLIAAPANLKTLRLEIGKKKVETFEVEELRRLLKGCVKEAPRTMLYLLLMMNCGMYQSDISDLGRLEVDFDEGRVQRPRSKTPDGPVVTYVLWPETLGLLRAFAAPPAHGVLNDRLVERVLLTERGKPLVQSRLAEGGRLVRTDNVKSAYRRLLDRLRLGRGTALKRIRKTSATLLARHPQYKYYVQYFLGQSPREVADSNYVVPSDPEFFDALGWLRREYRLDELAADA